MSGRVDFETSPEGLRVRVDARGLPPGVHAFHVHVTGDCTAPDASSAGPHFRFDGGEGPVDRIAGNLGELHAGEGGTASVERRVAGAELSGRRGILGRSVVVHARGNDPDAPPDGDAGERIACGVVRPTEG